MHCFGVGLAQYLYPEDGVIQDLGPAPDVSSDTVEKVEWPGGVDDSESIGDVEKGISGSNWSSFASHSHSASGSNTDITTVNPVPTGVPDDHPTNVPLEVVRDDQRSGSRADNEAANASFHSDNSNKSHKKTLHKGSTIGSLENHQAPDLSAVKGPKPRDWVIE
jgi:hypothetical protein